MRARRVRFVVGLLGILSTSLLSCGESYASDVFFARGRLSSGLDGELIRVSEAGGGTTLLDVFPSGEPMGVAVDATNGHVYWSDVASDTVRRVDLDGANGMEFLVSAGRAEHLQVVGDHLYWLVTAGADRLHRVDLTGDNRIQIFGQAQDDLLRGFWVLAEGPNQGIYYLESSGQSNRVSRRDLDGTNPQVLGSTGFQGADITGNPDTGYLYWIRNAASIDALYRGPMTGWTGGRPILWSTSRRLVGITIASNGTIYMTHHPITLSIPRVVRVDGNGDRFSVVTSSSGSYGDLDVLCTAVIDSDGDGIACTDDCDDDDPSCSTGCDDEDGDGVSICEGDCDDANPNCTTNCNDNDGDGYCQFIDCDDSEPSCTNDCADNDHDLVRACEGDCDDQNSNCRTNCSDGDFDGYCVDFDCDDANPNCTWSCTDDDADGYCVTEDCNDASALCAVFCGDADGDGASTCDGDCDDAVPGCTFNCVDGDGDGVPLCAGDCDDTNPACRFDCADADADGIRVCDGDCNDNNPLCGTDCTDSDLDGWPACYDCDDSNPNCTSDCTDADEDGLCVTFDCFDGATECTTNCVDQDGDGVFACAGDCDDLLPQCTFDCSDADGDGIRACEGDCDDGNPTCGFDCIDTDGDGICASTDCNDGNALCALDCGDGDGDGVTPCDGDTDNGNPDCGVDSTDLDGDGYCAPFDCDESNPNCTADCTDADADGYCVLEDCDESIDTCTDACEDLDFDGRFACADDCDDGNPSCQTDCTDADLDGYCADFDCDEANPYCSTSCTDVDGDGYCLPGDCLDSNPNCLADCTDADGDGYCVGTDCDDDVFTANPGAIETCADGVDSDCNGVDDFDEPLCLGLETANLRFTDAITIEWDAATGAEAHALYRGNISSGGMPRYDHRCEASELPVSQAIDPDTPRPAEGFYYLAAGMEIVDDGSSTRIGVELGKTSGGAFRPDSSTITCGPRIYVDADSLVDGDGLSWATAYSSVSAGLLHDRSRSRGLEVWVTGTESRQAFVDGSYRQGVRVLGGFAGVESLQWDRDPETSPTVLEGPNPFPLIRSADADLSLDGFTIRNADTGVSLADGRGALVELVDLKLESISGYGVDVTVESPVRSVLEVSGSDFDGSGVGGIRAISASGVFEGTIRRNTFAGGSDAALRLESRATTGDSFMDVEVTANEITGGAQGVVVGSHVDFGPRVAEQQSFVASNLLHDTTGDGIVVEASGTWSGGTGAASALSTPAIVGNTISDTGGAGIRISATRDDSSPDPTIHEVRAIPEIWDNLITHHAGPAIAESTDDVPGNLQADPAVVGNDLYANTSHYLDEGTTDLLTVEDVNALTEASDNLDVDPSYVNRPARDYHVRKGTTVSLGTTMTWLANASDPDLGSNWVHPAFDDSTWATGPYGVGYDEGPAPNASELIRSTVPAGATSVYTRAIFAIDDVSQIDTLLFGADHDDGWVAWINGVEVARSASMPAGPVVWSTVPESHESSNGSSPAYEQQDISTAGIPLLLDGDNVLAVAVWNEDVASPGDLVLVPLLILNDEFPVIDRGSPSPPRLALEDIDGEARVVDGDGDAIARPDLGADERR